MLVVELAILRLCSIVSGCRNGAILSMVDLICVITTRVQQMVRGKCMVDFDEYDSFGLDSLMKIDYDSNSFPTENLYICDSNSG